MKMRSSTSTTRTRIGFRTAALVFLALTGCAAPPERAAWREREKSIQPLGVGERGSGSLVVETVFLGTDEGSEVRQPFHLYDEQGAYLDRFPNHTMPAIRLPAGRYVVVTSIHLTNRRVQVVVKEGLTTRVTLDDFKAAPAAGKEERGFAHEQ